MAAKMPALWKFVMVVVSISLLFLETRQFKCFLGKMKNMICCIWLQLTLAIQNQAKKNNPTRTPLFSLFLNSIHPLNLPPSKKNMNPIGIITTPKDTVDILMVLFLGGCITNS